MSNRAPAAATGWRANLVPGLLVTVIALLAGALITFSLEQPAIDVFVPTPAAVADAGRGLVGPVTYTVDASSENEWRFFDFSRGSVVINPAPLEWDLAFQRFHIIANGGSGFGGGGGLIRLDDLGLDSVAELPESGYVESVARRDSTNAAIQRWYEYSWTSHLLKPLPAVYGVRTADGRYAKLQVLGYYCPGAVPGCLTFQYVYQGAGGRVVAAPG